MKRDVYQSLVISKFHISSEKGKKIRQQQKKCKIQPDKLTFKNDGIMWNEWVIKC